MLIKIYEHNYIEQTDNLVLMFYDWDDFCLWFTKTSPGYGGLIPKDDEENAFFYDEW